MSRLRPYRLPTTWVMLVTLVMAALLPTLSRATAQAMGDMAPWSVVCAAPAAMVDTTAPVDAAGSMQAHCTLCLLQAAAMGMPPNLRPLAAPAALGHAVPRLFLRAPRPLHAWSSAQARAPPRSA